MKEFNEMNKQLNYSYNNPEKTALMDFILYIVKVCAKDHPENLSKLEPHLDLLTIPGVLNSKKNYDGLDEIANACLSVVSPYLNQDMSKASMRK